MHNDIYSPFLNTTSINLTLLNKNYPSLVIHFFNYHFTILIFFGSPPQTFQSGHTPVSVSSKIPTV